ncbi:hypothetical protein [Streptomyces sp. NPDC058861]|uniref:hypothetical protein n=1 Tax=Streptomyces sp. NPDC058861 TaxID=3346653 RepID=UPI003678A90C
MSQQQRNRSARRKVLATVGTLAAVVVIGAGVTGCEDGTSPQGGAKQEQPARQGGDGGKASGSKASGTPGAAEKKAVTIDGDGDFQVGSDVKPGLYRTRGNENAMCYWERSKDASGEPDAILANDNVTGTAYVEIKATDKLFKSSDCETWEAVDPKAAGTPGTTLKGDGGMFKVGLDIAPGTYRSTGNKDAMCYWERSKDASHGVDSILANDNATGTAVVKVTAKDGYFKSSGCGDWAKTS